MSIRILFVDDEPLLLSGLERSLRPLRKEWKAAFAPGGEEALALLARVSRSPSSSPTCACPEWMERRSSTK